MKKEDNQNGIHKEHKSKYWYGRKNKVVRYYFYIQQGLTLLNEFRYLIMAVMATYALLKLENPWVMPLMFFISLPTLGAIGYISVHHIQKVMEWLNIEYTTHFSRYNIDLQEEQVRLQKEQLEVLKELKEFMKEFKIND